MNKKKENTFCFFISCMARKLKRAQKSMIWLLILLVSMIFASLYHYNDSVKRIADEGGGIFFRREVDPWYNVAVYDGEPVNQTLLLTRDGINRLGLYFGQEGNVANIKVHVEIRKMSEGIVLQQWDVTPENLQFDQRMSEFSFSETFYGLKGQLLQVIIQTEGADQQNHLTLFLAKEKSYGELSAERKRSNESLAIAVGGPVGYISKLYIAGVVFALFVFCMVYWMIFFRRRYKLEHIFVVVGILFGFFYLGIFTPYTEPDGCSHASNAFYYANIWNGNEGLADNGNTLVRGDDYKQAGFSHIPNLANMNLAKENIFSMAENEELVSSTLSPIRVPFITHLPQSFGVALGYALHLGAVPTLYVAKVFAFAFYLFCIYWSIKLIPFGKNVIFCCAFLPICMELAGSFSYDCEIIALSYLVISYQLYCLFDKRQINIKDILALVFITIWLSPIKVVYVFVCAMCLLLPAAKFGGGRWRKIVSIAGIMGAGVISILLGKLGQISTAVTTGNGENYYTLKEILLNPGDSLMIVGRTIQKITDDYLGQMFGRLFSWFSIGLPWLYVIAFVLVVAVAALIPENESVFLKLGQKVWIGFLTVAVIGSIAMSIWLTWTTKNFNYIEGIQGRYFIPILPLLLFLLRGKVITVKRDLGGELAIAVYLLQYSVVLELFSTVITR